MVAFKSFYKWLLFADQIIKMYTSMKKIQKEKDVEPTEFEQSVAQVICWCHFINVIIAYCIFVVDFSTAYCYRHCLTWRTHTKNSRVIWRTCISTRQRKNMLCWHVTVLNVFLLHHDDICVMLVAAKLMSLETVRQLWSMFLID